MADLRVGGRSADGNRVLSEKTMAVVHDHALAGEIDRDCKIKMRHRQRLADAYQCRIQIVDVHDGVGAGL